MRRTATLALTSLALAGLLSACTATGSGDPVSDATAGASSSAGPGAADPGSEGSSPSPGPTGSNSSGSELPRVSASEPSTALPPPPVPAQAHLTLPLPPAASAQGTVVAGFPTDIIPVSPDAAVVASSVTGQGDRLQIALETSSATAPTDVLAFYRTTLVGLGFLEEATPAVDGSVAASFIRGGDGIVVSVRTALGGGSQTSIAGALQAVG